MLLVVLTWGQSVQRKSCFDRVLWQSEVLVLSSFVLNVRVVLEWSVEAVMGPSLHKLPVVCMERRSAFSVSDDATSYGWVVSM